jgi:hypothetical protein
MGDYQISTKTTGFGSPARAYSKMRISPNELIVDDPLTTFFFQWDGENKLGLNFGDYLVVDREKVPDLEDLVVFTDGETLGVDHFKDIDPKKLWGTITWKLCRIKK